MNRSLLAFTVVLILLVAGTSDAGIVLGSCPSQIDVECNILLPCFLDIHCSLLGQLCCHNKCGLKSCAKPVRVPVPLPLPLPINFDNVLGRIEAVE